MKTKRIQQVTYTIVITTLVIAATLLSSNTRAASLKERMKSRLPQIIQLKSAGIIGEDNRGFLELRSENPAAQKLITAENQDRQIVYNAIAKQQNTTPENVGQRRAAQIAARAPSGTWLQNSQGEWYKK